ncbi:MAG: hypothetical protein ACFFDI_20475 [Promethearchaeota archaeon]
MKLIFNPENIRKTLHSDSIPQLNPYPPPPATPSNTALLSTPALPFLKPPPPTAKLIAYSLVHL